MMEPVAEETLKKACEAFAETYVTYPDECASTPVTEWFKLDAQDAVDFGVLAEPKWHGISDIRVMEHEQYVAAVIRNPMRAALSVRLSDAEARIEEITKWRDEWKDMATELKGLVEEWQARAEAAEALLKEAGPAIEKAMAILRELEGKLPHALGMAVGDAIDQLRFPASATRAIHHKIGVKDE